MRRWVGALAASAVMIGTFAGGMVPARAAGIVTHAWMATDAIDRVSSPDLHALLDAHRDQVRAGAQFPDGGYYTRGLGTPGGDYGEEAHWQRFVDAYIAQVRADPNCRDLLNPNGPCAPTVAHLMGVAAHGMGDEVWDWMFEPNGPGFDESYLPPAFTPFAGPGGLELQMDLVAIMQHGRPTGPTPELPDPAKIMGAFASIGRSDIAAAALPVGESFLEIEMQAEAFWAPQHIDALERAMPWTSAHMTSVAGGVDFAARAIAGYFDTIWAKLQGKPIATRVAAMAPFPGQVDVPATGWSGNYSPGSNPGNKGGLTRVAAALSSALPYHALAGQGAQPSELPADALRLRDLRTGRLIAAQPGYPRIVPYNPEAGEHTIAFQPQADLQPCRWYQVETTRALVDAGQRPVRPTRWQFRTSGCVPKYGAQPVRGTLVCDAQGGFQFSAATKASVPGNVAGGALMQLTNCAGGEDGTPAPGASLPAVSAIGLLRVEVAGASCAELTEPSARAIVNGGFIWQDAQGHEIGRSSLDVQPVDIRGGVATVSTRSPVFGGQALALRLTPDATACGTDLRGPVFRFGAGTVTTWPR